MFTKEIKTGINKTYNNVEAVNIYDGLGKNNSCHIKQTVLTVYPSAKMNNEFSSALFKAEGGEEYVNTRYSFVPVPKGKTIEEVQTQLNSFQQGMIYRIYTNNINDILTEGDYWSLSKGYSDIEELQDKYEVQDKEGVKYAQGKVNDGTLPREYKRDFFYASYKEDIDKRTHKSSENDIKLISKVASEFDMVESPFK